MNIEIGIGGWYDADRVMPVMEAAFDPVYGEAWSAAQLTGLLAMPGNWLSYLKVDGRIAGFAVSRSVLNEAELMLLAVSPDFRRMGLGQKLLAAVVIEARRRDVQRIFLEMRSDNERALSLYGNAGFVPVGQRPRYYQGADGILRDAITMSLTLV